MIYVLILIMGFIIPEIIYILKNKGRDRDKVKIIKRAVLSGIFVSAISFFLFYLYKPIEIKTADYGIICLMILSISVIYRFYIDKINDKNSKRSIKSVIFVMIAFTFLLEMFLFNIRHYDTVNLKNEQIRLSELSENDYELENMKLNGKTAVITDVSDSAKIKIKNINKRIKSVNIDFKRDLYDISTVCIEVTDDANQTGNKYSSRNVTEFDKNSKYISISPSGTVYDLTVNFVNFSLNENFEINDIILNDVRDVVFLPGRMVFVFSVLMILYIMNAKSRYYDIMYKGSIGQRFVIICFALIQIWFMYQTAVTSAGENKNNFNRSQYNEISESILKGKFYIDEEPPKELIDMTNPYDYKLRRQKEEEDNFKAKWDYAFYDGKYYVYFGVVPAILLYIPAYELFGVELNSYEAVFILSVIFLIGSIILFEGIRRVWFKNRVSIVIFTALLALFVNSSGILYCLRKPNFYEIAVSASLAFSVTGFGLLINAKEIKGIWKKRILLIAGAFFLACTVGSRPNCILYSLAVLPLFWEDIFKKILKKNKQAMADTALFLMPYIIIGVLLMYYNYARFGSVKDFGNNYQLTFYDMKYAPDFYKIPLGLWIVYLQPPIIKNVFPFVNKIAYNVAYQGYFYVDSTLGSIFTNLLILFGFRIKEAKKENKNMFYVCLSLIIIAFTESVLIIMLGGVHQRYYTDILWPYLMAGSVTVMSIINNFEEKAVKQMIYRAVTICFVTGMMYNIFISFTGEVDALKNNSPKVYYAIERAVEFWL